MASMTRVSFWTIIAYVAFHELERGLVDVMASQQERQELDRRVSKDETVIPSETGGKSLQVQENLALGRIRCGETMMEQLGHEGYQEMGHKGDLSTGEESGQESAKQEGGVQNDESKSKS